MENINRGDRVTLRRGINMDGDPKSISGPGQLPAGSEGVVQGFRPARDAVAVEFDTSIKYGKPVKLSRTAKVVVETRFLR